MTLTTLRQDLGSRSVVGGVCVWPLLPSTGQARFPVPRRRSGGGMETLGRCCPRLTQDSCWSRSGRLLE
jgi:hypothetical protein